MGRALPLLVLLALIGCASPVLAPAGPLAHFDPLPDRGATFEGRHRVLATLGDVELATLRARLQVWVLERRGAEADLWVRVHLLVEEGGEAAFDDVRLTIDATGRITSPPRSLCTSVAFDELASTRMVWSLLGLGPYWTDEGPSDRGLLRSELDEGAREGEFHSRHEDGGTTVLGRGTLNLLGTVLGGTRLRGSMTLRSRQRFDGLLVRRTSSVLEGMVEASAGTGTRRVLLTVHGDSILEAVAPTAPPTAACASGTPAPSTASVDQGMLFAMQNVVEMIDAHRAELTRCYEARLSFDPTLEGRVRVSMTVQESGEVTDVHVVQDTLPDPEVARCVVDVVDHFVFPTGPVGDSVTYAFPFVFSPMGDDD